MDLVGRYTVGRASFLRRFAMDAYDALSPGHPVIALVEIDVTIAEERIRALRQEGTRITLFAFLIHAIASTLAEHPDFNSVRGGRRIFTFEDVDVAVPVEVQTPEGPGVYQLVIRRAHEKRPVEVFAEIDAAHERYRNHGELGAEDRSSRRLMRLTEWVPPFVRRWMLRRMMASPLTVKRRAGTTLVTAIGKFATASGFVVPLTGGPRATQFALGSVVAKPVVVDGQVVIRSMQSLTAVFEHALVDGAPAARFMRCLQERIEAARGL